jgi:hypothetical protein
MFFLLFRGRFGPLLRAAIGLALVVFGIADSATFVLILGGVLIVWAAVTGIHLVTGRGQNVVTSSAQGGRDRFGPGR